MNANTDQIIYMEMTHAIAANKRMFPRGLRDTAGDKYTASRFSWLGMIRCSFTLAGLLDYSSRYSHHDLRMTGTIWRQK
jgi:hypothetical protein